MAVDKAIDSTKLNACLDAEANAIRAKTGGTSDLAFDFANNKGFADEIAAISSGGGSLPSVISKIDGGSFTLASDTAGDRQSVSHSLGVVPKGFVIWTEDELSGTEATRYLANCGATVIHVVDKASNHYACSGWVTLLYNGNASIINNALYTDASRVMDAQRIIWGNPLLFYKAGCQYKWFAWA